MRAVQEASSEEFAIVNYVCPPASSEVVLSEMLTVVTEYDLLSVLSREQLRV